jgi:hypothetical protein
MLRFILYNQEGNEDRKQEKSIRNGENSKEAEDRPRKKFSFILLENGISETSYDVAVRILRNFDEFESYTILESFFKDIVEFELEIGLVK